jgi:hypothetical protein
VGPLQGGSPNAIQSEKCCRAPNASWQLASSDAGRGRPRHRGVCKDSWRTSEDDGVAREFGHNDAARTPSREQHKSEQGYRRNPRLAETVGKSRSNADIRRGGASRASSSDGGTLACRLLSTRPSFCWSAVSFATTRPTACPTTFGCAPSANAPASGSQIAALKASGEASESDLFICNMLVEPGGPEGRERTVQCICAPQKAAICQIATDWLLCRVTQRPCPTRSGGVMTG